MAKFSDVVKAISDRFQADNPASGIAPFHVGEKARHLHRSPGNITFASPGGTFSQDNMGSGPSFIGADQTISAMLRNRSFIFTADLWCVDQDSAELTLEALVRAMTNTLSEHGYRLADYDAVNEMAEKAGEILSGFAYIVNGTIRTIIPRETTGLADVTTTPTTGEYQ